MLNPFNNDIDDESSHTIITNKNNHPENSSIVDVLTEYQNDQNIKNFRLLLNYVLSEGLSIDMKMKNDQTLLHHAVSHDLVKEVSKILNCGAILSENKYGKTPLDIALERGNQIILQILCRSADYQNYIKEKYNDLTLPKVKVISRAQSDTMADTIFGQHKYGWSHYVLDHSTHKLVQVDSHIRSVVYDDYLDWSEHQRSSYQQHFLDMLNKAEKLYHADLGHYSERKKAAIQRLRNMDSVVRDREHRFCMKIWSTVVGERDSRCSLEQISQTTENIKKALDISYQHVHFSGEGQMRYYNGFVMKLWKQVHIRLTGLTLRIGHEVQVQSPKQHSSRGSSNTPRSSGSSRSSSKHKSNTSPQVDESSSISQAQAAKSRTIMLDTIERVEVTMSLPLFPRVQALTGRCSSVDSKAPDLLSEGSKVYFVFHFHPNAAAIAASTSNTSQVSSPVYQKQRQKAQEPPKHPIALSLDVTASSSRDRSRIDDPMNFLNALKATIPFTPLEGVECLMSLDEFHHFNKKHVSYSDSDSSFSSYINPQVPYRSSESQATSRGQTSSLSPSEWSQGPASVTSGRTSVESLLTARSSQGSNSFSQKTLRSSGSVSRSSQSSGSGSQHRSTISSLDDYRGSESHVLETNGSGNNNANNHNNIGSNSGHHLDSDARRRPPPLGSVTEERESRYSNDSHSSHSKHSSHSRNNSNSIMSTAAGSLFAFSSDIIKDHARYIRQEATDTTDPENFETSTKSPSTSMKTPSKQYHFEKTDDNENDLVDVDMMSYDSHSLQETPGTGARKDYREFADTIGGVTPLYHSNNNNNNNNNVESPEKRVTSKEGQTVVGSPLTSRRPSLLAISLQNSPSVDLATARDKSSNYHKSESFDFSSHLISSGEGQMSFSAPLTESEILIRSRGEDGATRLNAQQTEHEKRRTLNFKESVTVLPPSSSISGELTQEPLRPLSYDSRHDSFLLQRESESSSVMDLNTIFTDRLSIGSANSLPANTVSTDDFSLLRQKSNSRSTRPAGPQRSVSISEISTSNNHSALLPSTPSLQKASSSFTMTASVDRKQNRYSISDSINNESSIPAKKKSSFFSHARPVPKLLRVLSKVRNNRNVVQAKLVECITKREAHLEILHYLQSLRALVKNPPTTPLYKPNSTPDSVLSHIKKINRKAFSLLTLTRSSEVGRCEARKQSEEEYFYNEHSTNSILTFGNELSTVLNSIDERLPSDDEVKTLSLFQSLKEESFLKDMKASYEAESFVNKMLDSSTSFLTTTQKANQMSNSLNSNDGGKFITFDNDVLDGIVGLTASHLDHSSSMRTDYSNADKLLSKDMSEDLTNFFLDSESEGDGGGEIKEGEIKEGGNSDRKRSASGISSLAQLGTPPHEVVDIYMTVRNDLEEVWQCDLLIFETVEKLAHCLLLREQTWSRLHRMKNLEKTVQTPDIDDLYDIEL